MAKKSRIYITGKQRKAADAMVENGGNASKAMRHAGYSKNTAHTPSKLLDSRGFQALMEDMGLTDAFLLDALQEDIKVKQANRKPELELAFKIKGRMRDDVNITSNDETIKSITMVVPKA